MKSIEERIEEAFSRYDSTIDLLNKFVKQKSNVQEFILLVCARLDALSNLAFTGKSQKDNFIDFLKHHSGLENKIHAISLPDFFEYLSYQLWVLPGSLEKDGRLHMFDPRRDEQFFLFVWHSGIPITRNKVGALLKFLIRAIKQKYRVLPNHKPNRQSIDTLSHIVGYLESAAQRMGKSFIKEAIGSNKHLSDMIKDFSLGALLYRKYRCGIIHEYGVDVDSSDFFSKHDLYWQTVYSLVGEPTRRLRLQFPAKLLLELFTKSLQSYKLRLQKTKQLPIELFTEICNFMSETEYLDEKSIPSGKDVGVNIRSSNSS
jgi:hypothetical protein